MAAANANPWVQFLRQYGPIPRNDNMYDETIQRSVRRSKARPVEFAAPFITELVDNFRAAAPDSVVLTGTAGDGKTFLCRKVWEELGGDLTMWQQDDKVRELQLPSGQTLVVIKDLSELREEVDAHLRNMADAVCGGRPEQVFLIAANDGQLVDTWNRVADTDSVSRMRSLIEELLVGQKGRVDGYALRLFNLSRTSAAEMLRRILDAVIAHEGWQGCSNCPGMQSDLTQLCPIWENYNRLQQPLFQQRLGQLLELCDHNEYHLPIRQLLMLVSNILLGHPDGKDRLLRCADAVKVVANGTRGLASPYSNVFGENLTPGRRESVEAFEVLNRFGVGEETSNRIDNLLIYGADDTTLLSTFELLIKSDPVYGANERFAALQNAYLEGTQGDDCGEFMDLLSRQRQRLFFVTPTTEANALRLWDLTVFQFAGEYLDEVCGNLQGGQRVPRHILGRLVRGMNRVFTGMLTTNERQVVLATSGSYSHARVSHIEEAFIEVDPSRGQRVTLELRNNQPTFVVYLDRDFSVPLALHLVRYEFLSRVSEGTLPNSFSRECYEDLLAFKSKLLSEYRRVVHERYQDTEVASDVLDLKILSLDARGAISSRPIEVKL
jgi:hypothetical protein